ncbi:MAG: hypothetical protein GY881_15110 [Gammaproteobacteria bacterium]|jgi:hypothetical protein|nr:hypothetical protein [Gammaproteobacteria bacterium]
MGFFSFFNKDIAEPVEAVGNVIDKLFTSDEERVQAEIIKRKLEMKPALVQAEITKVQVSHRSMFVAGARPFLMWVCGSGLAFAFIINPVLEWLMPEVGKPTLPLDAMMELVLAMLGLAGMRTVEKLKGVAK